MKIKPLQLEAGQTYIIGAAYTPQTKENIAGGGSGNTIFSDGAIRWVRRRRVIRQPELAFPPPGRQSMHLPGGFGPNFLIESSTKPRRYYRTQKVDDDRRYITIDLPESEDGSHQREHVILVTLFANQDGKLTQVLLNGKPLGSGEEVLTELNGEVDRLSAEMEKLVGVPPNLRIAAASWVRYADVLRVVDASTGRRVNPRVRRTPPQKLEFATLMDTRIRHVQVDASDRFVDHGQYVEDTWTGLLWQKDGAESGKMNFYAAADYAAELELGGVSGWRVPTIEELASIFPADDRPFTGFKYTPDRCCEPPQEYASYWTSELARGEDYAYVYHWYADGGPNNCYASGNFVYVRCVHDPLAEAQIPPPEKQPKEQPKKQKKKKKKKKSRKRRSSKAENGRSKRKR